MNMKSSDKISGIIEVLKAMAMFEAKVAELYSLCASTWQEDAGFWIGIWRDEVTHANNILRIIDAISKNPEHFEIGRPFNIAAIKTIVADIENQIEMVKKGELTKEKLLFIANSLEDGFIEAKYGEIIKTDFVEYTTLMQKVVDDTMRHKEKIVQKIRKAKQEK